MHPASERIILFRKSAFVRLLFAPLVMAQSSGTFTATGGMTTARAAHTGTLLVDGKVLITGGVNYGISTSVPQRYTETALASAELYDPGTRTFDATGSMSMARYLHTATLLSDGRILITGGYGTTGSDGVQPTLASAEIYDPSTGTFTATGLMNTARNFHTATLLGNGKVLIAGGGPAELYDPDTGTFATTGPYAGSYTYGPLVSAATLLPDCKILITTDGGSRGTEIYDPVAAKFSLTSHSLPSAHWMGGFTATLLTNGKILFAGGGYEQCLLNTAEMYDPSTGTISASANMNTCRMYHTATLLSDTTVLVAGSQYPNNHAVAGAEVYDPGAGMFSSVGDMATPRFLHTATLLPDGTVLIAGGVSQPPPAGDTSNAETFVPRSLKAAPGLLSLSGNGQGAGAILHAGTHQVVSNQSPAVAGEALEIYCIGLLDDSAIPPQVAIGGRMAEVLWFGKAPGYANLNQVNVRVPAVLQRGPAVPVRMTYLGRHSNEVTIGVQ